MSKGWREMNGREVYIVQDDNYEAGYSDGFEEAEERIIEILKSDCNDGIGDDLQGCFHEVAIELIRRASK